MIEPITLHNRVIPRLGLGCWTIGGPFWEKGQALGYGKTDDNESIAALQLAIEGGIRFFDTADVYGAGHSEILLGKAIQSQRDKLVISTKFGFSFNEDTKEVLGQRFDHRYIINACEQSLKRLQCDYIDIYHLHIDSIDHASAREIIDTLEYLIHQGKIKHYAWSTDDPEHARWITQFNHCLAIQHRHNVLEPAHDIVAMCKQHQLVSINRSPLAMGLLAKSAQWQANQKGDIRQDNPEWLKYFQQGAPNRQFVTQIQTIAEILKSNNRSLAAGALAWVWGSSPITLPIPGFRNCEQVSQLLAALHKGQLAPAQMQEISTILAVEKNDEPATVIGELP